MITFAIPGTNALRYISGFLLILLSVLAIRKDNSYRVFVNLNVIKNILIILILTNLYILLHTFLFSHEIQWSLSEYKGHWLTPSIFLFTGVLIGGLSKLKGFYGKRILLKIILASLIVIILFQLGNIIHLLFQDGYIHSRNSGIIFGRPDSMSYISLIAIVFIFGELTSRKIFQRKIISLSNRILYIFLVLSIISLINLEMRNAYLSLFFLCSAVFVLYSKQKRLKLIKTIIIPLLLVLSFIAVFFTDERSDELFRTIPVALDTENNKAWMTRDNYPIFSDGSTVWGSNYLRLAWLKKGIEYIANDPFGIGFGRNSFGHAIEIYENYSKTRGAHSHSALVDLTIGIGIQGLILWLVLIFLIFRFFYKNIIYHRSGIAIIGFLLTTDFFIRSIVDSNMRDHTFQMFLMLIGILLILVILDKKDLNEKEDLLN